MRGRIAIPVPIVGVFFLSNGNSKATILTIKVVLAGSSKTPMLEFLDYLQFPCQARNLNI